MSATAPLLSDRVDDDLVAFMGECAIDPYRFVMGALPWGEPGELQNETGPREWQRTVLQSVGDRLKAGHAPGSALQPVLQAVSSGHGCGKGALAAWLTAWGLCTCPDTKVVLTANTEPQLRTKTLPEMSRWFRLLICRDWFRVQGMSIVSTMPGHERTWRADAVTWSETNLEAFAGLHNRGNRILLVFDECSGIADKVWEVAEGALTDEDTEIVWLALGNPTQSKGRFAECFGRQRNRWSEIHVDSRTVPGTNKELFREWAETYGENSDFFKVRVEGEFPSTSSAQFIGKDLIEGARKREVMFYKDDALITGVDVARQGADQSVLAFRKGLDARSIPWIKLRSPDLMQVAAAVADAAHRHGASACMIFGRAREDAEHGRSLQRAR